MDVGHTFSHTFDLTDPVVGSVAGKSNHSWPCTPHTLPPTLPTPPPTIPRPPPPLPIPPLTGGTCTLMPSSSTCRLLPEVDYCSVVQAKNAHGLLSQRVRSRGTRACPGPVPGLVRVEATSCDLAPSHPCPSCDPLLATGCGEVLAHWSDFSIPCTDTDPTFTIKLELLSSTDGTWQEKSSLVVGPQHTRYDLKSASMQMAQEGQYRTTICAQAGASPSVCATSSPFEYDESPSVVDLCLLLGAEVQCGAAFLGPVDTWQGTPMRVQVRNPTRVRSRSSHHIDLPSCHTPLLSRSIHLSPPVSSNPHPHHTTPPYRSRMLRMGTSHRSSGPLVPRTTTGW